MSASFAMMKLLKPLKWAHLQVPLVPVSMMDELIHYPAPFMLGIPTDEKESAAILGALPHDVTLIDLDVGRVILASVFANDSTKSSDGEIGEAVAGALRSQVLYLAESLGGAFGAAIHQNSWCIDSPLQDFSAGQNENQYSGVVSICEDFISELLSGKWTRKILSDDFGFTLSEHPHILNILSISRHSLVLHVDRRKPWYRHRCKERMCHYI